jgi:hypothetical protein
MPHPADTLELASRLRRDADATCFPEYSELLRRAAADLESFVHLQFTTVDRAERRAG